MGLEISGTPSPPHRTASRPRSTCLRPRWPRRCSIRRRPASSAASAAFAQRVEDAVPGDQPQDDSELYAIASAKLNAAAAKSDLTTRAADNTRSMLTGLSKSLGYDSVTVKVFDPPAQAPAP